MKFKLYFCVFLLMIAILELALKSIGIIAPNSKMILAVIMISMKVIGGSA